MSGTAVPVDGSRAREHIGSRRAGTGCAESRPMDDAIRAGTETEGAAASPPQPSPHPPFFAFPDLIAIALDAGKIGVWSWEIGTHKITWSTNVEEILGFPQGTIDGTTSVFESDVHPDDRAVVLAAMQETLQSLKPRRVMYRLRPRPGGEERWIETLAAVQLEGGAPMRLFGLCRDVTDRARNHHELRVRASQQEAVARLSERALTEGDLQKFFDEAVATIAQLLDVELVKILELVPGDSELLLRSGVGWKPGFVGVAHVSTTRETQAGFTLASGGPVILDNLAT